MNVFRLALIMLALYLVLGGNSEPIVVRVELDPDTNTYYEFVSEPRVSWNQARQRAWGRKLHGRRGHLATITSPREDTFVRQLIADKRNVWIAASDSPREGTWIWTDGEDAGTPFFKAETDECIGYSDWNEHEPNDQTFSRSREGEDYAMIAWNGQAWNDVSPDGGDNASQGYVVEYPPSFPETVYSPHTGSGYRYVHEPGITWHDAAHRAEDLTWRGRKGHLATIVNRAEEDFLRMAFPKVRNAWMGASDQKAEGEWRWVAGPEADTLFYVQKNRRRHTLTFDHWGHGEPNDKPYGSHDKRKDNEGEDYAVWRYQGRYWNDLSNQGSPANGHSQVNGFLVEFSTASDADGK